VIITERNGDEVLHKCELDKVTLWTEYPNGEEVVGDSCGHFVWVAVGNGCYPEVIDENVCQGVDTIKKYKVKVIKNGSYYFFLIPRFRDYY
jgi:hypothetical protein